MIESRVARRESRTRRGNTHASALYAPSMMASAPRPSAWSSCFVRPRGATACASAAAGPPPPPPRDLPPPPARRHQLRHRPLSAGCATREERAAAVHLASLSTSTWTTRTTRRSHAPQVAPYGLAAASEARERRRPLLRLWQRRLKRRLKRRRRRLRRRRRRRRGARGPMRRVTAVVKWARGRRRRGRRQRAVPPPLRCARLQHPGHHLLLHLLCLLLHHHHHHHLPWPCRAPPCPWHGVTAAARRGAVAARHGAC